MSKQSEDSLAVSWVSPQKLSLRDQGERVGVEVVRGCGEGSCSNRESESGAESGVADPRGPAQSRPSGRSANPWHRHRREIKGKDHVFAMVNI